MAGFNIRASIWRYDYSDGDNVVGGASPTGTMVYEFVRSRFQSEKPTKVLMEQGIETNKVFEALIIPGTLDIRENDLYQIVRPKDHYYYQNYFRIIGVQLSSHTPRDPRTFLKLYLSRVTTSRDVAQ